MRNIFLYKSEGKILITYICVKGNKTMLERICAFVNELVSGLYELAPVYVCVTEDYRY